MSANNLPVPPHSVQAEQAVLGGLMLEGGTYHKIQAVLSTQDFYRPDHKVIFEAISQLHAANSAVDVVTVADYLESKGLVEKAGGLPYIGTLVNSTPSTANIGSHAEAVKEKSNQRAILQTANEMITQVMSAGGAGSKAIIAQAENAIFALAQQGLRGRKGFEPIKKTLAAVIDKMEEDYSNPPKNGVIGQSTGFVDLDAALLGLSPGDLVIVAARPSMGKTTLAMNLAEHVAVDDGKPVAVFSMEMSREQLAQRSMASTGGIPLNHIRQSWTVEDHEWALVTASMTRLGPSPLYIDDTPALSFNGLRSRAMRLTAEIANEHPEGLGLIVVDYIQLMSSDVAGQENRNGQIEEITRGLKQLAKELGVPVIALSQLNRNLESRPNKRPVMSDLRDSGSIEQDADIILFPYRDEVYNKDTLDKGIAEVIIGKQRNGALGTVRLLFEGQYTRFRSLDSHGYGEEDY